MNRSRWSTAVGVVAAGLGGSACSAAPPAAGEAIEVTEARQSAEVIGQESVLRKVGWVHEGWDRASVQREDDGRWAVAIAATKAENGAAASLVYTHDAQTGAANVMLQPRDEASARALRDDILALNGVTSAAALTCDKGCDASVVTCVSWLCTYVSAVGSDSACTTLLNPLGIFTKLTVRTGKTNPFTCQAFYPDWVGLPISCPKPNQETSVKVCWAV